LHIDDKHHSPPITTPTVDELSKGAIKVAVHFGIFEKFTTLDPVDEFVFGQKEIMLAILLPLPPRPCRCRDRLP
jgi:hypothetical protein